jgi:hypothetical protein
MKPDWKHLERKLAAGKTIDQAAAELGLSPEIVRERYDIAREATTTYGLEAAGCSAIETALATLSDICTNAPNSEIRVLAAGHLLKFGTAAMKAAHDKRSLNVQKKQVSGLVDLFDAIGDWNLTKPGG